MTNSPTIQRRRLSAALRALRIAARLGMTEVAKRLDWDPAKITRMEANRWVRPDVGDIRLLLDLYCVTDEDQREALITMAREARQRGWWADYKDVFRSSLPDFEAGASVIRAFELVVVPGLLQTPAYIEAIFQGEKADETLIKRRVDARLARQKVLDRPTPPALQVVLDESALRKHVGGPAVMREQLQHLVEMGTRSNITLQIVPDSVGTHAGMDGSFTILDFPTSGDTSLVFLATATDDLWREKPEEYQRYTQLYSQLQTSALSPEESADRIVALKDQLEE